MSIKIGFGFATDCHVGRAAGFSLFSVQQLGWRCDIDFMSIGIGFGFAHDFCKIGRPAGLVLQSAMNVRSFYFCGHQLSFNVYLSSDWAKQFKSSFVLKGH